MPYRLGVHLHFFLMALSHPRRRQSEKLHRFPETKWCGFQIACFCNMYVCLGVRLNLCD